MLLVFYIIRSFPRFEQLFSISDFVAVFIVSCPQTINWDLKMRYIAAALLLQQAGQDANAANIKKILGSVGIEADKTNLDLVLKNLEVRVESDFMWRMIE